MKGDTHLSPEIFMKNRLDSNSGLVALALCAGIFFGFILRPPVYGSTFEFEGYGICGNPVDHYGQFPPCGFPACRPFQDDGPHEFFQDNTHFDYFYKGGKVDGLFRSYRTKKKNDGGEKRVFLTKYRYAQGVLNGTQKLYNEDKEFLFRQCEIKMGTLINSVDYTEKEQMKIARDYDGKEFPHVIGYKKYAEDGSMIEQLNGVMVRYFSNGKLSSEETYDEKIAREFLEKHGNGNGFVMLNAAQ